MPLTTTPVSTVLRRILFLPCPATSEVHMVTSPESASRPGILHPQSVHWCVMEPCSHYRTTFNMPRDTFHLFRRVSAFFILSTVSLASHHYNALRDVGETGGNCNLFQINAHYVEHVVVYANSVYSISQPPLPTAN